MNQIDAHIFEGLLMNLNEIVKGIKDYSYDQWKELTDIYTKIDDLGGLDVENAMDSLKITCEDDRLKDFHLRLVLISRRCSEYKKWVETNLSRILCWNSDEYRSSMAEDKAKEVFEKELEEFDAEKHRAAYLQNKKQKDAASRLYEYLKENNLKDLSADSPILDQLVHDYEQTCNVQFTEIGELEQQLKLLNEDSDELIYDYSFYEFRKNDNYRTFCNELKNDIILKLYGLANSYVNYAANQNLTGNPGKEKTTCLKDNFIRMEDYERLARILNEESSKPQNEKLKADSFGGLCYFLADKDMVKRLDPRTLVPQINKDFPLAFDKQYNFSSVANEKTRHGKDKTGYWIIKFEEDEKTNQ